MDAPEAGKFKPKHHRFLRLIFLLWLAILAFGLPEMLVGSSPMWLFRPNVAALALPVYMLHFLVLTHIAVRSRRTSWPALYIFGVLFGLYETWITKVVWHGYPGADQFSMGGFGQWFGIHETLGLVLFYHPVAAFLLPIAVISRLFPAYGKHFPTPDWVFGKTKGAFLRRLGMLLLWGLISGHNLGRPEVFLLSWMPMLVVLWVGYIILRKKGACAAHGSVAEAVARPVMGRWGFIVASLLLALIYSVHYHGLLPQFLPPPHIQLITLGFYLVLIWGLRRTAPITRADAPQDALQNPARMPAKWLLSIFLLGLLFTILVPMNEQIRLSFIVVPFLSMVPLGVGLFLWLFVRRAVIRPGKMIAG